MDPVEDLLVRQDGVIARRQVLACGHPPAYGARRLRRREWVAVLATWPAALSGWSAVRAHEGPGRRRFDDSDPIEVVVRHGRRPPRLDGVRTRESRRFDESTQLHLHPPRQRYDDAVIELADRADDQLSAIAVLADACGGRRTTAARLRTRLDGMSRPRRRSFLARVLDDVADGTCSVLEHGYLTLVERAHGLPRGRRQVSATDSAGRPLLRDVVYRDARSTWSQIVELDGRLHHGSARDRDRDLERDLDAALDGADTVRIGYGQVFRRGCSTADKVGRLLQVRGWQGAPVPCR